MFGIEVTAVVKSAIGTWSLRVRAFKLESLKKFNPSKHRTVIPGLKTQMVLFSIANQHQAN